MEHFYRLFHIPGIAWTIFILLTLVSSSAAKAKVEGITGEEADVPTETPTGGAPGKLVVSEATPTATAKPTLDPNIPIFRLNTPSTPPRHDEEPPVVLSKSPIKLGGLIGGLVVISSLVAVLITHFCRRKYQPPRRSRRKQNSRGHDKHRSRSSHNRRHKDKQTCKVEVSLVSEESSKRRKEESSKDADDSSDRDNKGNEGSDVNAAEQDNGKTNVKGEKQSTTPSESNSGKQEEKDSKTSSDEHKDGKGVSVPNASVVSQESKASSKTSVLQPEQSRCEQEKEEKIDKPGRRRSRANVRLEESRSKSRNRRNEMENSSNAVKYSQQTKYDLKGSREVSKSSKEPSSSRATTSSSNPKKHKQLPREKKAKAGFDNLTFKNETGNGYYKKKPRDINPVDY